MLALALGFGCSYEDSADNSAASAACVAGRDCTLGLSGACDRGVTRCPDGADGRVECAPVVSPTSEVCDGVDNDCDGRTDEGIPNQSDGSDVGLCQPQILACEMGEFVELQERIDPQPEVCGDGLDQDCDGSDCSSPPEVTLVSPTPGTRLIEGSRILIAAEASDADGIDRVEFLVDGRLEGTDQNAPYRIFFTVPLGVREIGIEARAVDETGLDATTGVQLFPVDPDPGTTVQGRVVDPWGDPLTGAVARIRGAAALNDTTGGDGRFEIDAVPTIQGDIVVDVLLQGSARVIGTSDPTPPLRGGVTDVGTILAATVGFEDDLGEDLDLDDDDAVQVSFASGFLFPFYGETYSRVFVSSNGRLTFSSADDANDASLFAFNLQPGIAPLFDDLDPDAGNGGVFARRDDDRLVVTWDRVEVRKSQTVTFQIVLFDSGSIQIGYLADRAREGIVGITPGFSPIPAESDLSDAPPFTGGPDVMIYEFFEGGGDSFDLDERFLLFLPDGSGAYRVRTILLD